MWPIKLQNSRHKAQVKRQCHTHCNFTSNASLSTPSVPGDWGSLGDTFHAYSKFPVVRNSNGPHSAKQFAMLTNYMPAGQPHSIFKFIKIINCREPAQPCCLEFLEFNKLPNENITLQLQFLNSNSRSYFSNFNTQFY